MRKKFLVSIAVFVAIYFGTYWALSTNREVKFVDNGYRIVSMHNAVISDEILLTLYGPLVRLDELTMGHDDLDIKPE